MAKSRHQPFGEAGVETHMRCEPLQQSPSSTVAHILNCLLTMAYRISYSDLSHSSVILPFIRRLGQCLALSKRFAVRGLTPGLCGRWRRDSSS